MEENIQHETAGHEAAGHEAAGHETTDAAIWPIVLAGVVIAAVFAAVLILSIELFHYFVERPAEIANPLASANEPYPPAPRIEDHPATELQQLRQQEDQILSTYGWVDRKTGRVRIPIDRAIDLQLERGFPTRKETKKQ